MDVVVDELRKNGIDIDKTTLSYFINKLYYDNPNVYGLKFSYEDLFMAWEQLRHETFRHVMAFLTAVHFQDLSDKQKRDVVRLTVPVLENIDLSEYKREKEYIWDKYTLVQNTIHRFLHRYVCCRLDPVLCYCYIIGNVIGTFAKRWRILERVQTTACYLYYKIQYHNGFGI